MPLRRRCLSAWWRAAVDGAVLPIENSLHGSVAEHYDLLLAQPVRIARESLLRVRHNLIARPGVAPEDVKRVMSHPVALSQCRHWLAARPWFDVVNFYDTAGSVKHLMAEELDDTAGIAPELAARQYGAEVLVAGIEDHAENFTRFHLLLREPRVSGGWSPRPTRCRRANKASLAFSVEHRPGSLVRALEEFARGRGEPDQDRVAAGAGNALGVCVLRGSAVRVGGADRRRAGAAWRATATW